MNLSRRRRPTCMPTSRSRRRRSPGSNRIRAPSTSPSAPTIACLPSSRRSDH
jgi:hypothetical protein